MKKIFTLVAVAAIYALLGFYAAKQKKAVLLWQNDFPGHFLNGQISTEASVIADSSASKASAVSSATLYASMTAVSRAERNWALMGCTISR